MKRTYRTEHPLYIIPAEHKALREMFEDHDPMEISDLMPNGDLHVYASEFGPETPYGFDGEWDYYEGTLSDFMPEYTPTPEEVVRALRGPQGDTGPMGPKGDQGECLKVEDEPATLPILPDETDLSTKDFVDLSYSLEDQADESSTTLYRAILTWHEGVRGMTHFTLPRTTKAEAVRSARIARSQGRHDWSTVYEYREPGGNWTRLFPNETSMSMEARSPEKRNIVFGYWSRR